MPTGATVPFAGPTAPEGWLLCDGSAVSRTTYADLFAAIGTTWGAGDGSTTFNIPDMRGRIPRGVATSGTGNVLGQGVGTAQVTPTLQEDLVNPQIEQKFGSIDAVYRPQCSTFALIPQCRTLHFIIKT